MPLFLGNACRGIPEICHLLLNDSLRIKVLVHLEGERKGEKGRKFGNILTLIELG